MKLYTYYRSQASFRVRIALNLKGVAREEAYLHLEKGDQFAADYRALNPQMVVPTLIDGETRLFQSLAILEYLDEKYPTPLLLPSELAARAWVRGLALINIADSHPLVVPRIRHYLTDDLGLTQEQLGGWIRHWLAAGLAAMEALLAEHAESGRFCHGDAPTLADIGLVTQVTPAQTFGLDLAPYPRVRRVYDGCMAIPAFADAHPAKQPDAEKRPRSVPEQAAVCDAVGQRAGRRQQPHPQQQKAKTEDDPDPQDGQQRPADQPGIAVGRQQQQQKGRSGEEQQDAADQDRKKIPAAGGDLPLRPFHLSTLETAALERKHAAQSCAGIRLHSGNMVAGLRNPAGPVGRGRTVSPPTGARAAHCPGRRGTAKQKLEALNSG